MRYETAKILVLAPLALLAALVVDRVLAQEDTWPTPAPRVAKLSYRLSGPLRLVTYDGETETLEAEILLYGVDENGVEQEGWATTVTCTEVHDHDRKCVLALMPEARAVLDAYRAAERRARSRKVRVVRVADTVLEERAP